MIKKMQKTILIISILMMVGMASAASADVPKAGHTPGDILYTLDRFSESLELTVAKAPVIGSSELEAKVRANHAAERISEAQKLAENNQSEKVDKLMAEYTKQANLSVRSAKKANNTNFSERLGNVTNNHVKALQNVQQRVPEQAQKGIQNAIEQSQKNKKKLELPEVAKGKVNPGLNRDKFVEKGKPNLSEKTGLKKKLNKTLENRARNLTSQNLENSTEDAVEETQDSLEGAESKITGKAVGNPSKPGLN